MFYTGINTQDVAKIGLATSTDLSTWERLDAPVFTCHDAPWTWCDEPGYGLDFRDPFVMPDPDVAGGWLMYYATRRDSETTLMVPGLAKSGGDLTHWEDAGPLFSLGLPSWQSRRGIFESPHLFEHDGTWYIAYTTNDGQQLLFAEATDSPSDTSDGGWTKFDTVPNVDCFQFTNGFASEYFADTVAGGHSQGVLL